ncbi:MAG: mechanosensitive ion channel [Myxococcales bacterium]|nr:mechanosensitive ion channel [Myxococcales bacterium]
MRARTLPGLVVVITILLLPVIAYGQDTPDFSKLADVIRWGGVAFSLLIIVGSMIVLRIVDDIAERLSKRFANRRPTIQKFESAARFAIYIVAAAICVALSFRLDSTAITVIGGALAFSIGFAMRDLVAAFIAGITIMIDRPFQVGDRVSYAGEYGDVIKIGLRSVQINTLDHNIVTIPNNKILTDVTSSGNYGALEMQVAMDFYIGVDQDIQQAIELVREACLTSPYVFLEQPVPVLVKQTIVQDYVAIQIKARPYVFDCRYEKAFETDVHLRVAKAFSAEHILPPAVLHRTVAAPTFHIQDLPKSL